MGRRWVLPVGLALLLGGCADGEGSILDAAASAETPPTNPPTTPAPTAPTTTDAAAPSVTPEPIATAAPAFVGRILTVTEEELGSSWRAECPVAVADLRRLQLSHWDNEGNAVEGALVVHADHADDLVTVFRRLFDEGFPIESMRPITDFDADDDASMAANNSSAFNCRRISGRPGVWSQHSYGAAVDINPLVNPWVRGPRVDPPGGAVHLDRDPATPGLIVAGDVVTEAFGAIGWTWGGDWTDTIDYQHFSRSGG